MTGLVVVLKLVDDMLVFADSVQDLENCIERLFKRCLEHQITLGDNKVQAGKEVYSRVYEVNGFEIKPDPTKIEDNQNYCEPMDLMNLKSFIGLSMDYATIGDLPSAFTKSMFLGFKEVGK